MAALFPALPPGFPWDFKSMRQSWIFFRPLSGTGAFLALLEVIGQVIRQMAVLPKQTERSTKKGKIHLCQHIIFPWLDQGCGMKATGARFSTPRIESLGLFKESLQKSKSLGLQNKHNVIFMFEKRKLS